MAETRAGAMPDPKTIQKWFRRVSWGCALVGFTYLFLRFSILKTDPRAVAWPYRNVSLIVDEWPRWGRDLEAGDLVFYQFAGEPEPRPVLVVGLGGDAMAATTLTAADGGVSYGLRVGSQVWPHGPGPALDGVALVPEGRLVLLNHVVDAPWPDSRSLGPVPVAGVESRVIWYWPSDPK